MTKLILALNVDSKERAREIYQRVGSGVDVYKIGIDLWTRTGPELVKEFVSQGAEVFLDLKFCDIPSVVAKAVAAAAELGVKMLTVHTMGGAAMLYSAVKAAQAAGEKKPLVLGVTVLTSFDRSALAQVTGCDQEVETRVVALAELAQSMGCDGVVAAPLEIKLIRKRCGPKLAIVTPGIRLEPVSQIDDQARTLTPAAAAQAGADYIVVGRPIYEAADPGLVIAEIKKQLGRGDE
ncbi:MAG: orotidine-5'-phosphate decarboxylase [candidate division WOR-3 bacterium]|jgi:orotidine-5'-phosphate decarboxylase|nr:orotidine-5'-phosphate decarboxylase [candidate division WOR-3 bacterium]MCR4423667.1 orotidine-5'-phosphate decarboxylase [candidate division WOR-3 bacterium]MDH7519006.1 orotidine-5'-phosphate decarboxylase [bacterium]